MYVSIDIETGGLHQDFDILQVAAVKWDHEDVMKCSFIDIIIDQRVLKVTPYAARMNASLIAAMAEGSDGRLVNGYNEAWDLLGSWLGDTTVIGKNASGFDIPFMRHHGFAGKLNRRVLDIGSLYANRNGIPSLIEILESTVLPFDHKLHDALWDARVCLWLAMRRLER